MAGSWREVLEPRGVRFDAAGRARFAQPAEEARRAGAGDVVVPLDHLGLAAAHGPEAHRFLQDSLAGDVDPVAAGRAPLAAQLNVKGRVLALWRLVGSGNDILLQAPRETAAVALPRLRMYVLRSKVTLVEEESLLALGLAGPRASELLEPFVGAPPAEPDAVEAQGPWLVRRCAGATARFEVIAPPERMAELWDELSGRAAPAGADAWRLLELQANLPQVHPQTVEAFLPQFLDLDRLGGVSFTKGCYPGQEVVARTQHRGRVVRRLCRLTADAEPPAPGTPLRALQEDGSFRDGGTIVEAVTDAVGRALLLAVVPVAVREAGQELRLGFDQGPLLEPLPPLSGESSSSP